VSAIGDRYTVSKEITTEQIDYLEELFDGIKSIKKEASKDEDAGTPIEEQVTNLEERLSEEITDKIDSVVFMQLLRLKEKERKKGEKIFINSVQKILDSGVRIENIQSAKEEIKSVLKYSSLEDDVKEAFTKMIDFSIVENSFFDIEKTIQARNEAVANIDPVMIRSGDIIVREGQIITNEIYEELKLTGLLSKGNQVYPAIGLSIFIIFLMAMIGYELIRLHERSRLSPAKIIAVLLISIIVITLMKIASLFTLQLQQSYLLVPIATGVLLVRLLIFERLSIVLAVFYSVIGSIIFNGEIAGSLNFYVFIYFLFFQFAGIYLLKDVRDRVSIVKTSFGIAIVNVMTIIMYLLLSFESYELKTFLLHASFGIGAAILSAVLTIGLLPFFETGLGILSDSKLLHLANPNQPLLRKLLTEAPGTYHHSVMVANLSETACEAIGANGLLARVGAYYHDIGKTVNPHYFIENQVAIRNPHDFIEPEQSATIIINHVIDGVKLLKEHKLPKEIIDIAAQHHGTSMVEFFYHKAKQENEDVMEEDFRYPGPIPTSKEAGIISICDSVEAAVRSLKEPSTEKIEEIVTSIINKRLTDGQFNHTPLT